MTWLPALEEIWALPRAAPEQLEVTWFLYFFLKKKIPYFHPPETTDFNVAQWHRNQVLWFFYFFSKKQKNFSHINNNNNLSRWNWLFQRNSRYLTTHEGTFSRWQTKLRISLVCHPGAAFKRTQISSNVTCSTTSQWAILKSKYNNIYLRMYTQIFVIVRNGEAASGAC